MAKSVNPTVKKPTNSGGDAFSDLFASSNKSNGANMTMAERAALAEKQRLERLQGKQPIKPDHDHASQAWAGLDQPDGSSAHQAPGKCARDRGIHERHDA